MNSYIEIISDDTSLPVTLEQIKKHLQIEYDDDDTIIENKIKSALTIIENETNRKFTEDEWRLNLDSYVCEIELPMPPLLQIDSVKYYNTSGVLTTTTDYTVSKPMKLPAKLRFNKPLAIDSTYRPNAIQIEFTSSSDANDYQLVELISMWVYHLYHNPEGSVPKNMDCIERLTKNLKIWSYK